jgi:hypothetical protein
LRVCMCARVVRGRVRRPRRRQQVLVIILTMLVNGNNNNNSNDEDFDEADETRAWTAVVGNSRSGKEMRKKIRVTCTIINPRTEYHVY